MREITRLAVKKKRMSLGETFANSSPSFIQGNNYVKTREINFVYSSMPQEAQTKNTRLLEDYNQATSCSRLPWLYESKYNTGLGSVEFKHFLREGFLQLRIGGDINKIPNLLRRNFTAPVEISSVK